MTFVGFFVVIDKDGDYVAVNRFLKPLKANTRNVVYYTTQRQAQGFVERWPEGQYTVKEIVQGPVLADVEWEI